MRFASETSIDGNIGRGNSQITPEQDSKGSATDSVETPKVLEAEPKTPARFFRRQYSVQFLCQGIRIRQMKCPDVDTPRVQLKAITRLKPLRHASLEYRLHTATGKAKLSGVTVLGWTGGIDAARHTAAMERTKEDGHIAGGPGRAALCGCLESALSYGHWQAEGNFEDDVHFQGRTVSSGRLKLPGGDVLQHGALHAWCGIGEERYSVELAVFV